ncbi:hypothetical protein DHBDCA_p727 [Dehalobacter sp. DCA]|nr:hypothetical protein DHBDCA_p727 [Dehalobacter sp. DCA]
MTRAARKVCGKAAHIVLSFFAAFPETKAINLGVKGQSPLGYT